MRRMSVPTRALVGATAIALAAATSLMVLAPAAQAITPSVAVANTPTLVAPATASQAIGNIVLTESAAGAITTGAVHISLLSPPTGTVFTGTATATATGTGLVLGTVVTTAADISIPVTTASTVAGSITVSGLQLTTVGPNARGPVDVTVGKSVGTTEYNSDTRIAYVGTVGRIMGSNRYATAAQIATTQFPCNAGSSVVIARGDNFPDALAASYLAGKSGTPLLLTAPDSLPNETIAALKALGATGVTLVGGTSAITTGVENVLRGTPSWSCAPLQLQGANLTVARAFGADRYATARTVALQGGTPGTLGAVATTANGTVTCSGTLAKTAIVASGENFPDALAAGGLSFKGAIIGACGAGGIPVLLTQASALPTVTANTITDLGITQVILLGGTSAVAPAVETAIDALPGVTAVRVAGTTRQGTAVAIGVRLLQPTGYGPATFPKFLVTRGDNFPDALAAGPLAGKNGWPLFLTDSTTALGSVATAGITGFPPPTGPPFFNDAFLLGGTDALSAAVATQTGAAIAAQA